MVRLVFEWKGNKLEKCVKINNVIVWLLSERDYVWVVYLTKHKREIKNESTVGGSQ